MSPAKPKPVSVIILTPKKKKAGPGALLGAVALALAVGTGDMTVDSGSEAPVATVSGSTSPDRAGDVDLAGELTTRGYVVMDQDMSDDDNCHLHSYGQVRAFFGTHQCTSLKRTMLIVRDRAGGVVVVAHARVVMPDDQSATAFKQLMDERNSGSLMELSRRGGPYRNVRFTDDHYKSVRNGTMVTSAHAVPIGGAGSATELAHLLAPWE